MRYELGAVVGAQHRGIAPPLGDVIERADDTSCRKREVELHDNRFAGEVVDDREKTNLSPANKTIAEEIN